MTVTAKILKLFRNNGVAIDGPDEHWRIIPVRNGDWQWQLDWTGPRPTPEGMFGSKFRTKALLAREAKVTGENRFGLHTLWLHS